MYVNNTNFITQTYIRDMYIDKDRQTHKDCVNKYDITVTSHEHPGVLISEYWTVYSTACSN